VKPRFGQLGDGSTAQRLTPVRVPGLEGIAAVSSGLYHSLAIREDGLALAWGLNSVGQLGDGTTTEHHSPVWVPLMPPNYAFVQVSTGGLHSLAVTANAAIGATGWNRLSQVNTFGGDMQGFGQPLPLVAHVVSAGWYHSLLIHSNGSVCLLAGTPWASSGTARPPPTAGPRFPA
jgi:alpha-tubulin suppressor-like RCC1 family protein